MTARDVSAGLVWPVWALLPALASFACRPPAVPPKVKSETVAKPPAPHAAAKGSRNPLGISADASQFDDNPRLLGRVLSSPHGYFRFINIAFSEEVCRRFADSMADIPSVNLHGDAHLEQYAVSEAGRGLSDFDDSSVGPAILDLVRVSVSLRLAAQSNGWGEHSEEFVSAFLRGYREGLSGITSQGEPAAAERFRRAFVFDRLVVLKRATALMQPLDVPLAKIQNALDQYSRPIIADGKIAAGFFRAKKAGVLRMGIGSALDTKYLVRVEGPSASEDDDIILEAKEVRDLSGISCIVSRKADPFRVLVGQARLAYQPFKFAGYVRWEKTVLWVHAWVDNYVQLSTSDSFQTPQEVVEIAVDIGRQLGYGHPNLVAAPLDDRLRAALQEFSTRYETRIRKVSTEMAKQTAQAYWQFVRSLKHK